MGNTCWSNEQEFNFTVGQNQSVYEYMFFKRFPAAYETYEKLKQILPKDYHQIPRKLATKQEERIFLGKDGEAKNGLGIMIYPNEGFYYIGNWTKNRREGLGAMIFKDGSYYQGQWYDNYPTGYGQYYNSDKTWSYKGKWNEGKKSGSGQETYPDGTKYRGQFQNDMKQGKGTLLFQTECSFSDPQLQKKTKKCHFQGIFDNDAARGYGVELGFNFKFEGQWQNNQMNGVGKCIYYNQAGKPVQSYIGQFKNSMKHGFGEYRWEDGRVYKGEWEDGQLISKGVLIDRVYH